jgi:hypothetical protein
MKRFDLGDPDRARAVPTLDCQHGFMVACTNREHHVVLSQLPGIHVLQTLGRNHHDVRVRCSSSLNGMDEPVKCSSSIGHAPLRTALVTWGL